MKHLVFSFFLLTVFFMVGNAFAQDYNKYISKADSLYDIKEYSKSGETFESAFKLKDNEEVYKGHYYNAACSFSLGGDKDKAFSWLTKAVAAGWMDLNWMKKDPDLDNIRKDDRWEAVLEKTQKKIDEYEKDFNKPLRYELFIMRDLDQELRRKSQTLGKEKGYDAPEFAALWDSIRAIDLKHTNRVKEIIAEHGWPGNTLVGEDGSHAAWLLIQHADLEDQANVLPLLAQAVENGEASKRNHAYLVDRVNMRLYKKQLYGTQFTRIEGESMIIPIEQEHLVDERRAEIGLPPLAEYAKRFAVDYNTPSEDAYKERKAKEEQKYEDYMTQARAAYDAKKYEEASDLYYDAITLRVGKGPDFYEAARALARNGEKDEAFRFLNLALLNGWASPSKLKKEAAFKSLRTDKRWKAVMERANLGIEKGK